MWHETNSFVPVPTRIDDFRAYQWVAGSELLRSSTGTATELGGMIAAGQGRGAEAVPLLFAGAVPSGTVTASALGELMRLQREAVGPALPLDAIAFVLHGAMVAESEDDVESRVLAGVRDVVGDLPIVKGVKTPI